MRLGSCTRPSGISLGKCPVTFFMIVRLLKRPTRFHPPASPAHQALSAPRGVRRLTVARKARGNSRQSQRPGRTFSGSGRIRFLSTKYVLSRSSAPLSAAAQTAKVDAKPGVPSQRICFRRPASEQALIMPCRMPLQLCSLLRKKVCSLTSAQPRGRTAAPGRFQPQPGKRTSDSGTTLQPQNRACWPERHTGANGSPVHRGI